MNSVHTVRSGNTLTEYGNHHMHEREALHHFEIQHMTESQCASEFKYDLFLSHSSKNKPEVRTLAQKLKADGLNVWFDEWIIQPGMSIPDAIEDGLQNSKTLVLVMSDDAFDSDWVTLERQTARFRDPMNRDKRFIPLLLEDTDIPDILKHFAYIDYRNQSQGDYDKLVAACR